MSLARLLPAAALLCSVSAFGQDSLASKAPDFSTSDGSDTGLIRGLDRHALDGERPSAVTPGESWRIIPNLSSDREPGKSKVDPDQFTVDIQGPYFKSDAHSRPLVLQGDGDLTCYTIRSYVVARDSKDSESTHPAGYSTCRPADRYQVRTTEMRVVEER